MSATESADTTELTPNDHRWPECIRSVTTSVEVEEVDDYGSFEDGTNRWQFGALPAGVGIRRNNDGTYEIRVFQDREAYERHTASSFRLNADRITLGTCFIEVPEDEDLRLRNVESFELRYTDEYGYTAWIGLANQNPADVEW